MKAINKSLLIYKNIWNLFRDNKKKLFIFYLIVSFVISFLEIASVIMFMNLVSFASTGEIPLLLKLNNYLNVEQFLIKDLFYIISFLFLLSVLFLVFLKFIENKINCKISYGTIYDFNNIIINKLASLNFLDHKKININLSISNLSKIDHIVPVLISNLCQFYKIVIVSSNYLN